MSATHEIGPIRPIRPIGPIIFGEVLFDVFPDGSRVLGGAPFNVAWHLHAFGCHPLFISCVGADHAGDEILARMAAWGMRTDGISRSPSRPTGSVSVSFINGQPSFSIKPDQAYDELSIPPLDLTNAPLLYCGSLCLRSPHARSHFSLLADSSRAPLFVDVNLRPPFYNSDILRFLLGRAAWFKCNVDELHSIASALSLPSADDLAARALIAHFNLRALILTLGAHGAVWYDSGGARFAQSPPPLSLLADTVGAGDAFSAVVLHGLLSHLTPANILSQAVAFAARICTIQGAIPSSPAFYSLP